jgi:cytochrome c oxidase subunit 4
MQAESDFSVGTYAIVLTVLIVATLATVALSFDASLEGWHMECGLAIGVLKASLVLLFFMHVLRTVRLNWIVIAFAILWLFILMALTVADYKTRGLVPHMPGH